MDWVYSFFIIALASMIQAATGFGFATLAVPLLLLIHDPHQAILLSNLLSMVSAVALYRTIRNEIDKPMLKSLFIGSLMGLPAGVLVYSLVSPFWLKMAVAITILMFTVFLLAGISLPLGKGKRIGAIAAMMGTSIGMPGPPIVLYMASLNTEKGAFRGTTVAFYCMMYPLTLLLQAGTGHIPLSILPSILLMVPAIFIGQAAGSIMHSRINQNVFRKVTYMLLVVSAVNSLVQTFGSAMP